MQLKANAWREPDLEPAETDSRGAARGGRFKALKSTPELEPIPTDGLDIAKLARGKAAANPAVETAQESAPYVTVALHRERLGITQVGGYFALKMRLVRTLRRGFRSSIIEVDDGAAPPESDAELFRVSVEPADPQDYARAVRTVRRVLRSRNGR